MIRSGSTVLYQIASAVVEARGIGERCGAYEPPAKPERECRGIAVYKLPWLGARERLLARKGAIVLYSYRDLEQAVASAQRAFRLSSEDAALWRGLARRHHGQMLDYGRYYPRAHFIDFARIVRNLAGVVADVAKWIPGTELTPGETRHIADSLSLERQKARPKVEPFDPDTLIFPNHFD